MQRLLCLAFLILLALAAAAQPVTRRYPSDVAGTDFVLTYDPAPSSGDYEAETETSLPDHDPYLLSRGLELGLVRLVNEHSRQVKRFTIPRAQIDAIVRIRYDMTVLDRVDLVVKRAHLVLVHTTTANAGLVTGSHVYELPFIGPYEVDRRLLAGKTDLLARLDLGLAFLKAK